MTDRQDPQPINSHQLKEAMYEAMVPRALQGSVLSLELAGITLLTIKLATTNQITPQTTYTGTVLPLKPILLMVLGGLFLFVYQRTKNRISKKCSVGTPD